MAMKSQFVPEVLAALWRVLRKAFQVKPIKRRPKEDILLPHREAEHLSIGLPLAGEKAFKS